nr:Gag-Pol polyprotein [Tanacetum cinerariifolium]
MLVSKTVILCLTKTTTFPGLLRYAKSKPNRKLIYNSIMHGPYVRRMIPEPSNPDREVLVAETFHEQTDEELTDKEKIWLRVQQMMKGYEIGVEEKNAKLFNECEMFTSTDARAEGNGNGNNRNPVRFYNCRGMGHLARNCTVRPRKRNAAYLQTQLLIAQKEEAVIQLQAKEFDLIASIGDLDEIKEVNANCILMANLQQAPTSITQTDKAPVYDSNGSAEAQSVDLKGKSKDTSCVSDTLDHLSQKLEDENVELELQV